MSTISLRARVPKVHVYALEVRICQKAREGCGCAKFLAGSVFWDAAGKFFPDFPVARYATPAKVLGKFRQGK